MDKYCSVTQLILLQRMTFSWNKCCLTKMKISHLLINYNLHLIKRLILYRKKFQLREASMARTLSSLKKCLVYLYMSGSRNQKLLLLFLQKIIQPITFLGFLQIILKRYLSALYLLVTTSWNTVRTIWDIVERKICWKVGLKFVIEQFWWTKIH